MYVCMYGLMRSGQIHGAWMDGLEKGGGVTTDGIGCDLYPCDFCMGVCVWIIQGWCIDWCLCEVSCSARLGNGNGNGYIS